MGKTKKSGSWAQIKALSGKERWEYIWDYYRYHILGIIGGILLLFILFPKGGPKPLLKVVMVNSDLTHPFQEQPFVGYLTEQGLETFHGCVSGLCFTVSDQGTASGSEDYIALSVHLAAGQDIWLSKGAIFENIASQDAFADLSAILPEETLASYTHCLLYAPEELGGYPCGILLKNNPWLQETGYFDECVFAVFDLAPHPENAAAFAAAFLAP